MPVATLAAVTISLSFLATGVFAAPCSINWTGIGDGASWDDPKNWDALTVPGASDHVCIEPLAATTVVSDMTTSVRSITTNPNGVLEVTSGLLSVTSTLDTSALGDDLLLSGSGDLTFSAGVTVAGKISITGSGAVLSLNGSSTASDLTGTGTLRVTGGTATTFPDAFTFAGDVILDNPVNSGNLFVTPAAPNVNSLSLVGSGDATFTGGVDVAGEISITGSNAVLSLDGPSTADSLVLSGLSGGGTPSEIRRGTDSSAGSLAVGPGAFTWGAGSFENGLPVTVNGATTINGFAGVYSLNTAAPPHPTILTLNGATTWTAGEIETLGGSEIVNNAAFSITHDAFMDAAGNPGTFTNNGTVAVNGSGITTIQPIFDNPGRLFINADAILNASAYSQLGSGALRMEVIGSGGPGVGHGQLIGSVTLDGALEIDTPTAFAPTSKFIYTLVEAAGVIRDDFAKLVDLATGTSVLVPPSIVDSDTHTWEVRYNQDGGSNVVLHTPNIFPVALDDVAETPEDVAVNTDVVASSDTDADGDLDLSSITIVTPPAFGSATPTASGTIHYTPDADENGFDTFEYRICDSFAKCDTATVSITVTPVNDPPSAAAGADQSVTAGELVSLDGSGSADPDGDALTYAWTITVPTGSTVVLTGADTANPSFTPDLAGDYVIELSVSDGSLTNTDSVTVSALAAPAGDIEGPATSLVGLAPNPVAISTDVSITATVDDTDTGGSTIAAAEYSINGGTFVPLSDADGGLDEVTEDVIGTIPAASFSTADVYQICVRGTDAAVNVGPVECMPLAVYDPDGGFVTGAGWIESPAGAYAADPDASGRGHFAFVSKYSKGRSVPDGNTKFMFRARDLTFESTAYEYLVVNKNDARAQFKGTGTINGTGSYGFLVWAIDDDEDSDTFRIEIWDETEATVYDNGTDQPISAGNITIRAR